MFYYPNVLQRHTGCFSTIWLAATKGIRISRRELLKVNVGRTCDDIMDYVTVQVAPLCPNLPRPRFSLYLSSQLQYGVVIVYHRQCAFLLEETQQIIDRLLRSARHIRIDMPEPDRLALDVPDSLMLMEEAEGAQDPFFGMMRLQQLPSPYTMFQPWQLMEKGTQQSPLVSRPQTQAEEHGFKSPLDAITLKEREQLAINSVEFQGAELPEATAKEIDLLLEQPDEFYGGMQEREKEREAEKTTDLEGAMTSIDQLKDSVVGADRDSLWLLNEETGRPMEVPLEVASVEMTPVLLALPTAPGSSRNGQESERETGSDINSPHREGPKKRGGRKQLIFADPQMQITQEAMMEQINNPVAETLTLAQSLIDLPFLVSQSLPAELFSDPSSSHLHPDLMSLWKQCAVLTTLQRSGERYVAEQQGMEEDEVDRIDSETEMLRGESRRKKSSFREALIDSRAPSEVSGASEGLLNVSKEDKSLDLITPVSKWSPQEEAQVPMEPIVEEQVEIPESEQEMDNIELTADSLLRTVLSYLKRYGQVTFDSLLFPEVDRSSAGRMLFKLLELASARQLSVLQTEPYSPIIIRTGLHACLTA